MPKVPQAPTQIPQPDMPEVDPTVLVMTAAMMVEEGRLPDAPEEFIRLAGDVVRLPRYPGSEVSNQQFMDDLKNKAALRNPDRSAKEINAAFDKVYGHGGVGAKVLPMSNAQYQKWLDRQGMAPR